MTGEELGYSKQQPGWHVFVLSVLTLGIYNPYWFYKNLITLNQEGAAENSKESKRFCVNHPYFSTLLFFIPVANLIIAMEFFAAVGELLPDKNSFWFKHNMLCAFGLALAFGALLLLGLLPEPYHLFYLLSALPLSFAQSNLNAFWKQEEGGEQLMRSAFNPIELIVIFFGAGLLGLITVGPSVIGTVHH